MNQRQWNKSGVNTGIRISDDSKLARTIEDRLIGMLVEETKLSRGKIDATVPFHDLGIDSVVILDLTRRLEAVTGELPKTLFFEHRTIRAVAATLARDHGDAFRSASTPSTPVNVVAAKSRPRLFKPVTTPRREPANETRDDAPQPRSRELDEPIAIIGVSGRYPEAANLEQLWTVLSEGRDCIREVPRDRWDADALFDPNRHRPGKSYSKWGGFLSDIAGFDHRFFGIAQSDADFLDPQERLWLETAWHTFEDAGYTPDSLRDRQVGVFVGVMSAMYQKLHSRVNGVSLSPFASYASIANRTSYHLDLNGPSLSLDTMCSSSLTAIHLACESIWREESSLALAGGVNVIVHPDKYITQSIGGWFSTDGRCRSFGEGGDGYVPGEGVGAVLLKRLSHAERDGDHIYGIIRSTAVNHCGRTNSYFVPNPTAQADVLRKAWKRAGIDPRGIGYLEAHGTGTSLGDPIEVRGISKAFEEFTSDRQFCPIGSIKSNVGHLESAAGVAALTKVLLQLKHRMLVPSLHNEPSNPHIAFERSPLYLQRTLEEWPEPELGKPRLAAISSFGAGGTNAHIVVEEYRARARRAASQPPTEGAPHVVLLSARDTEQLRRYAELWVAFLDDGNDDDDIADIAYTTQVGRVPMAERLALVVHSKRELSEVLASYLRGQDAGGRAFVGTTGQRPVASALLDGPEGAEVLRVFVEHGNWHKLAQLWSMGIDIDFASVQADRGLSRVSVPRYPFVATRCWLPDSEVPTVDVAEVPVKVGVRAAEKEAPRALPGPRAPEDALLDEVLDTLALISPLPRNLFLPEARLFTELNLDSLMVANFSSRMTAKHPNLSMDAGAYFPEMTVADLVRMVRERLVITAEEDVTDSPDVTVASQALAPLSGPNGVVLEQNGATWINFTTYDYLGLANHPRVKDVALAAVAGFGASASASRPVGGEIPLYQQFETRIADFLGTESAVLFVSGHATNVTTIHGIFAAGDLVLFDEGSAYSSIVEGGLVSNAEVMAFPHDDMDALDAILAEVRPRYRKVLIAVEAVCATDGSVANLPALVELKKRHDTFLLVDEDNSFGVLGETGRGLCEHHGIDPSEVDVISCGINKSLASSGGFIAGNGALVHYVKCTATSLIFAASIAPMSVGAAQAALEMLEDEPLRAQLVRDSSVELRTLLRSGGWNIGGGETPVVVLRLESDTACIHLANLLQQRGIVVEHHLRNDRARIPAFLRIVVTAQHTSEHLELLADVLNGARTAVRGMTDAASRAPAPPHTSDRVVRSVAKLQATEVVHEGEIAERYIRVAEFPEYKGLVARQNAVPKDLQMYWQPHESIVNDRMTVGGKSTINFSSFNYLSLSGHPEVIAAVERAIAHYGTSVSATRLFSGTLDLHGELESTLASFLGVDGAVVFDAGHNTNVSSLGNLFGPGDLVLHDVLAHNSMIQGALLSGATRQPFPHNDYRRVDEILSQVGGKYRRVCIAIEGVYSQDGDIPDLAAFVEVKRKHGALLFVDEAHSIGAIGKTGRGACEHAGIDPREVDILMGTLSKALGTSGGYVAGNGELVASLRRIPCYVHNTNVSPAVAAAALESLRIIQREPQRLAVLRERANQFVELAKEEGLDTGFSRGTAVIPIMTYSSVIAYELSYRLLQNGITSHPFTYPVVPENQARLRMFVNADHSAEQIEKSVRLMGEIVRDLKRANVA